MIKTFTGLLAMGLLMSQAAVATPTTQATISIAPLGMQQATVLARHQRHHRRHMRGFRRHDIRHRGYRRHLRRHYMYTPRYGYRRGFIPYAHRYYGHDHIVYGYHRHTIPYLTLGGIGGALYWARAHDGFVPYTRAVYRHGGYVCRARYRGHIYRGQIRAHGCRIFHRGRPMIIRRYHVLVH